MALKVTKASDPINISRTVVLIYGQPGVGKTSIGGTADSPLLLDFDRGAHRSAFRPDSVQIGSWSEAANLTAADLDGYKTLIVDTAGRALDYLVAAMPQTEGKTQLKRSSGEPTLQGYGAMKAAFTGWLKRITTIGLDVILIAHDKEDRDGDSRIIRPDITGGSYGEIIKVADFVGYVWMENGNRTIDFNPSQFWIGKNSAALPRMKIPGFEQHPKWFAEKLKAMKDSLGKIASDQKEAVDILGSVRDRLMQCSTPDEYGELKDSIASLDQTIRAQAWRITLNHAKANGVEWDGKSKRFTEVANEAA